MSAISPQAIKRISELGTQSLSNISWAFATIVVADMPLLEAIAGASIATRGPSVLWSLWKTGRGDLARLVYNALSARSEVPNVLELGLLMMDCAWRKDSCAEAELLVKLIGSIPVRLMRMTLWRIVALPDWARPAEVPAMPPYDVLGLSEQECRRYLKLARFVEYLDCWDCGHTPADVIAAVEQFPRDSGRWLKVAGGDKAVVLWDTLKRKPNRAHEVAVEFGALVGYTTVRLADVCSRAERSCPARARCVDVVSLELDACHACVARHSLDLAGLTGTAEVWIGQVHDLIPRLIDEFGCLALCFVFMDQKGTAFHEDLAQLENLGALGIGARVLADNCLKPGAPFFVWHVSKSRTYSTTIWSMPEFASEEIEDWMVVAECVAMPTGEGPSCSSSLREVLSQLAWETDYMRAKAERGAMHVDDWVAFSQYMLRYFALLGIEAVPWIGASSVDEESRTDMPVDSASLPSRRKLAS